MFGELMDMRTAKPEEFDKVFALLETSFPGDEYRSYEGQKALLKNPRYSIYILPDSGDGNIKAFVTVWRFEDFAYIEHFAVSPAYRNHGIGGAVLKGITELLPCQLCLETELPETEIARRRIGFYQRNGFFINEYSYIQPPYAKEKKPVPLKVMTYGGPISRERFEQIKTTIFREVYQVQ